MDISWIFHGYFHDISTLPSFFSVQKQTAQNVGQLPLSSAPPPWPRPGGLAAAGLALSLDASVAPGDGPLGPGGKHGSASVAMSCWGDMDGKTMENYGKAMENYG